MRDMTIASMMAGKASSGTGPIPTQTFYGANIAGTTVPKVGNAQSAATGSNAGAFAGVTPLSVATIVVAFIGIGYLLHHLAFEESVSLG